jgi:two-component system, NarL family, response regulator NreC
MMDAMSAIRVFLVDDHKLYLEGLEKLIKDRPTMSVVATAPDGREAVNQIRVLKPDVVLMDISMPHLNGIEATRIIKKASPKTQVLILTMHENQGFLNKVLEAGACGYLLKDSNANEVFLAIEGAYRGNLYLSPLISHKLIGDYLEVVKRQESEKGEPILTGREREILQLLVEGYSNSEAARHLDLSLKTVETHRKKIMKKLGVHHLADLVKYAVRMGMMEIQDEPSGGY